MEKRMLLDREARRGYAFVAPGLLMMALLVIYPIFSVIQLSFSGSTTGADFVGFDNYLRVVQNPNFFRIMRNTAIWTVGNVAGAFMLGTGAALLLNQSFILAKSAWRTVIMLSWITPNVVQGIMWRCLYSSDFGMVNQLLQSLGLIKAPLPWLSSLQLTLPAVMLVQVWQTIPFVMTMMYAGAQSIPRDLYEVANLEGANAWARLRHITLPLLKDVCFICLLMLIIWSLNGFTLIWVMTQGGPAGSTEILALSIYEKFRSFNFNGAAATSVLQLLVSLLFAVLYIRRSGREED